MVNCPYGKTTKGQVLMDAPQPKTERIARRQVTILVVDDDPNICQLLAEYLEARGYKVLMSSNGWDCLWEIVVNKPDGIILDIQMPKMDGLRAMDLMRLTRLTEHIPVVIASAKGDRETIMKAKELGADEFVVKPYSFEELVNRLERLLFPIDFGVLKTLLESVATKTVPIQDWEIIKSTQYKVWGAYPTIFEDREVCVLLPEGLDPRQALELPENEAVKKVVALVKFRHQWKCVWPQGTRGLITA